MKRFTEKFNVKRLVTLVMALALVINMLPTPVANAASGNVSFNITDEAGNAINDATIVVNWYDEEYSLEGKEKPNTDGSYTLLSDYDYDYVITKTGYKTATGDVDYRSGIVNVVLESDGTAVTETSEQI